MMKFKLIRRGLLLMLFFSILFLYSKNVNAIVKIENLQNISLVDDYVVGPGKQEIWLEPGEGVIKNVLVTNRFTQARNFKIELEDFQGASDPFSPIELLGLLKGPYSLKDYIKPEVMNFTLQSGDRITIPIIISVPKDAVPGGLYGSAIITTEPDSVENGIDLSAVQGAINLKSRIAVLYFVRVKGMVDEKGELNLFKTDKNIYQNGSIDFSHSFKNNGSVYLNPYGYIEIKNLYGTIIDRLKIEPYYVLPSTERIMKTSLDRGFMLGRYKAEIFLNHGYTENNINKSNDSIGRKAIVFWVMPWKIVVPSLVGLVLILLGLYWLFKNVQINVKKKK
ncbi:MAG: hypothetical protein Q7J14_00705 [Candidatus Magasanikbacteria bacterium]|nr:hypothetical protein [Candidatus Magasanikbacteria bacterium]